MEENKQLMAQPFMASSNQIMRNHGTIVNPKPYRALALLRRVLIDLGSPHFNPRFCSLLSRALINQANKQTSPARFWTHINPESKQSDL
jgi:hypothetical protein